MENIIQLIPVQGVNTSTFSGTTYYALNPDGLDESCYVIRIINNSNIDIAVSIDDGYRSYEIVPTKTSVSLGDWSGSGMSWEKGKVFWVRNAASAGGAGTGLIYLSGYYK